MATGFKTGGRTKGTRNRPRVDAAPADPSAPAAPDLIATVKRDSPFPAYKLVRVDHLIPYATNARTHTDAQIAKIAASVTEFGFTNPVLTDGKRGIVAGHGRVLAAKKLGLDVVPAIELSHLSAAQRRAYVLADNRLAEEAGWDEALLASELGELSDMGFDLALTGFDERELLQFMGSAGGNTDPDDVPDVPSVVVSETGDVWVLGDHRLVCGNCTDAAVVALVMDGKRAQLCLTDPPYGIGEKYASIDDSRENLEHLIASFLPLVRECSDVLLLTPGNINQRLYPEPEWTLAWFVPQGVGVNRWGFTCWHAVLAFGRDPYLKARKGSRPDALVLTGSTDNSLGHPCPKPVKVWSWFLERGSVRTSDHILDPFSGSGTTIIAAEMTGRRCHAIEIAPQYVDVAVRRWQAFTGRDAVLEATGETFEQTAAQRLLVAA